MGYRVVDPASVTPPPDRPSEYRALTDPAGLENVAVNMFRVEPGEQAPLAYHYHETQEELFFVTSGPLHVETPERTYEVPAGNLFAADPGSPHRAFNPGDATDTVELLAVGAPPVSGDAVAYDPEDDDPGPDDD